MSRLAERGWVCVAINYRLSPRATWPDHIIDVKRAIAWVRDHIADHGGDPDFLVITGGSAGGHLSSLAAVTPGLTDFQPGFEEADTSVAAAVPFYGVYDFTDRHGFANPDLEHLLTDFVFKSRLSEDRDRWDQASPMSHIGPDAPPFFVLHGTNDTLVPVDPATLPERLAAAGFTDARVDVTAKRVRFGATRPPLPCGGSNFTSIARRSSPTAQITADGMLMCACVESTAR